MNAITAPRLPQVHPLLLDACRCGPAGRIRCLACWRWHRHYRTLRARRQQFAQIGRLAR